MVSAERPVTDHYPPATWRLIIDDALDGATNMAIDEAIAEHVMRGTVPPTLRFYAWQPGCLSLGYSQPSGDADPDRLREYGWDIVRRLTGGRAILHIDELTYSASAPETEPRVRGGVIESYRRLSTGLLAGLNLLGAAVNADRKQEGAPSLSGPVCFEVPSDYEITVTGRKLLGSAQTRRTGVVLQHGALPLVGDISRICDGLVHASEPEREAAKGRVRRRAATLEDALGYPVPYRTAAESMAKGFSEALQLTLEPGILTESEIQRAAELRASRYAAHGWTYKF